MARSQQPQRMYVCPNCGELILRVYTAAQLDGAVWPVAVHRGMDSGASIVGIGALTGFRRKGLQGSYLASANQDDIGVSCTKCGRKFSTPVGPLLADLGVLDKPKRNPLPTRSAERP